MHIIFGVYEDLVDWLMTDYILIIYYIFFSFVFTQVLQRLALRCQSFIVPVYVLSSGYCLCGVWHVFPAQVVRLARVNKICSWDFLEITVNVYH